MSDISNWTQHYQTAVAALKRGDFAIAANEYEQALEAAETAGLDDERLANCLGGLAAARLNVDKAVDVSELFRRDKELREKLLAQAEATLGNQDPKVADCLDHCAFHAVREGEPAKALALHNQALVIRAAAYGEVSFEVANTMVIMASVHYMREKNEAAAVVLWEQAVRVLESLYREPDCDEKVVMSLKGVLHNLACQAFQLEELEKAESLFRRVIEMTSRIPGRRDLGCYVPIFAKVLVRVGKFEEAESILKSATECRSPPFAGRTGSAYKEAFIELYNATGRGDEARALEAVEQ